MKQRHSKQAKRPQPRSAPAKHTAQTREGGIARGRKLDALKGRMAVSADFNAPLPDDLQQSFEGH